jgi:molybdopterin synthase sulfur carrier subunit
VLTAPAVGTPAGPARRLTVLVPGLLRSYTAGAERVELAVAPPDGAPAPCLGDALAALDARFPGLRFRIVDEQGRIRPHIKLFVDRVQARELALPLPAAAELLIVGALSGG